MTAAPGVQLSDAELKAKILGLCKNKKVLDVGCVGPDVNEIGTPACLHAKICKVAKICIGIDVDREGVKIMRNLGYNVVYGNAEQINMAERFEVIIASDVIEHVSNQGIFLENLRKHLKRNGILIVVTTNAICPTHIIYRLFGITPPSYDKPSFHLHTAWHSEDTLRTIIERHDWRVRNIYYIIYHDEPTTIKGRFFTVLLRLFLRFSPLPMKAPEIAMEASP